MMDKTYLSAYWGIFIIILTLIIQGFVAAASKGTQPGAIPGKIDETFSHSSFVCRSNRTLMSSLENMPAMLGVSFLVILAGAKVFWTGLLIWVFAGVRLMHVILYYVTSTEKITAPEATSLLSLWRKISSC